MKRQHRKPKIETIALALPYNVAVPHGYKVLAQELCHQQLGRSYSYWIRSQFDFKSVFVVEEENIWQYDSGTLYFKHEKDLNILTMALLSKLK